LLKKKKGKETSKPGRHEEKVGPQLGWAHKLWGGLLAKGTIVGNKKVETTRPTGCMPKKVGETGGFLERKAGAHGGC